MSWELLAEMRDAGVDIQAHSATHQDLRKPYDKVDEAQAESGGIHQWLKAKSPARRRRSNKNSGSR